MLSFRNTVIFLIGFLFLVETLAQRHTLFHFDNESGLPSNMTKSIAKDADGLIWIATDGGLIRFNGREFESFPSKISSRYIKSLSSTIDKGMYVAADDGLGLLSREGFDINYKMLVHSSTSYNDYELYYPKGVYVDNKGVVWVSDITGIGRWDKGNFKKFNLNFIYHSNSFFRSFGFAESQGTLYITSWQGYLFYYDTRSDSIVAINLPKQNQKKIIHSFYSSGDSLFLGQADGLYLLRINDQKKVIRASKLAGISSVSSIGKDKNGDIYFGTYNDGFFRINGEGVADMGKEYPELLGISVKDFILDDNQNLWICSDEGVYYLQKRFFENVHFPLPGNKKKVNVREIFMNKKGEIFFYDNDAVFKIDVNTKKSTVKKVFIIPGKSILYSAASGENDLWISFTDKSIQRLNLKSGKTTYSHTLESDHFYSIFADSKGRVWAYLARQKAIWMLDEQSTINIIPIEYSDVFYINEFYESSNSEILIACNGKNNFFLRVEDNNKLISLSHSFKHSYTTVQAFDISETDDGFLLATDRGLIKTEKNPEKFSISFSHPESLLQSVLVRKDKDIWLGTEQGIIVYNSGDTVRFERHSGLQNSSVIRSGLVEDLNGNLWVATVNGISYLKKGISIARKSRLPVLLSVTFREKEEEFHRQESREFPLGSALSFNFTSPVFPYDRVRYRIKFSGSGFEGWSYLKFQGVYFLQNFPAGNYTIQISAKESGFQWSDPISYSFSITHAWYNSPLNIILGSFLLLGVLVFLINNFVRYRLRKLEGNKKLLEKSVEERTVALSLAKKEVEKLLNDTIKSKGEVEFVNEQIKKLLGIAAHDLKSPLQSIIGLSHLIRDEEQLKMAKEYADVINNSALKMVRQIDELLDTAIFDASSVTLKNEKTDVRLIINSIVESNRTRAFQKKQSIEVEIEELPLINTSTDWLSRSLDNLVNNAVKYSPFGKKIFIKAKSENNNILISVADEGPGFTESDIKNLFIRFKRLSARPTGGETSTGLGLALVKEMIDAIGGEIILRKSELGGAEFTIKLPIQNVMPV